MIYESGVCFIISGMLRSIALIAAASLAAAAERPELLKKMDSRAEHYGNISRQIWEFAEVGYKETKSSALLKDELRKAGFLIADQAAGIPTAFVASWGEGKPEIGILGEYDALPGLSQQDTTQKQPRTDGAPGHACGHNLLGTASAFAAIEVKQYMLQHNIRGTLRFYGTPAEEGGAGKVFMARAGLFNGLDAALAWHPGDSNHINQGTNLANINAKFRFHGKASHAALAPEMGRSALDALLLMSHAVDMLREHVPQSARLHYTITSGGASPNVVPDFAEGYFYARYPGMTELDSIWSRVVKCAEGAAIATETKFEMQIVGSVYNRLPNAVLGALFEKNLRAVGGIRYSQEELKFAAAMRKTFPTAGALPLGSQESVQPPSRDTSFASTDVSDVSWIVPTEEVSVATTVPGVALHSWQSTSCSGMSIGRKGMMVAAKTLALSALDLLQDPKLLKAASSDFEKRRAGNVYRSRIPAAQSAPLDYRGK